MRKIIIGFLSALVASGTLFLQSSPDGFTHIYFLNVGQGDSILIRSPSGENIIVDGGPAQNVLSELNEVLPFFDNTIDHAILTHPDRDHIEGLIYILKKYPVKHVIFAAVNRQDYFFDTFLREIQKRRISVTIADENSDILLQDGLLIDILFPFSQIVGGANNDQNNLSVAAKISYGEIDVLLTGDMETLEENALMRHGLNLESEILKVAHHGSASSSTKDFLKAVKPEYSVISAGENNTYGHPHKPVLKRLQNIGSKILRTDRNGRVEIVFDEEKITAIKTAR